jgi:hypothetical protein
MMFLAIIAPELIVFFAARQFFFARSFSKSTSYPFFSSNVPALRTGQGLMSHGPMASSLPWGDLSLLTDYTLSQPWNSSQTLC